MIYQKKSLFVIKIYETKKSAGPKKPGPHLNPIEDYDYENEEVSDKFNRMTVNSTRRPNQGGAASKISIPIDANTLRDKNHINVDIYLRLDEYMPKNGGGADYSNRSLDDFDPNNDPLAKHIRYYETNMSRSLPGSSGSINKYKTLPPLSKQNGGGSHMNMNHGGYGNVTANSKPRSHQEYRSSRSFDVDQEGGGYLAAMAKSKFKQPTIKPYTLKDYRRFKKDALLDTNTSTGKLGFDYENQNYRQKVGNFRP
jgi:hypothetical protein